MHTANFKFQLRRGSAAEWTADNPVLLSGEPGVESDTYKLKIGNGVTAWNDLDYFPNVDDIVAGVASVDGRSGVVLLNDLYAALTHAHAQSDITGLVSALAGKAAAVHTHVESDITGLVSDLAGKAATVHSHAQSDITGLVSALAGKAATVHTHAESDITGLTADLAGKADATHTHAASDVTSGVFGIGRIPTGTTSSTVSLGNHSHAPTGPTITVSSSAPSSPAVGDVWIDTSS